MNHYVQFVDYKTAEILATCDSVPYVPRGGEEVFLEGQQAGRYHVMRVSYVVRDNVVAVGVELARAKADGRILCGGCENPISDEAKRTTVNAGGARLVVHDNPRCINAAEQS